MKIAGFGATCLTLIALAMPRAVAETPSPYAGMERREIAALSEQQIDDLANGRGMGLALPAELNGYPGPRHALDLGDKLGLSPEQNAAITRLFDTMRTEAIATGTSIIADEAALDRLFAEQRATAETVDSLTARIAAAQGRLRAVHLRAHLQMMELLLPHQIARYAMARGYGHGPMKH